MKSLLHKERDAFFKANQNAIAFYNTAVDDYLGGRRCLIDCIIYPGHFLAAQAVEKMIKSHILFLQPGEITNFVNKKLYPNHHSPALVHKLKSISSIDLTKYLPLCEKLSNIHNAWRYPDYKKQDATGITTISTAVLHEVDELFFHLFDLLPMPGVVNCRTGILTLIFFPTFQSVMDALITANNAYMKRSFKLSKPMAWWEAGNDQKIQAVDGLLSISIS